MKKTVFFLFALYACLFSCTVPAPEDVRPLGAPMTFTASLENNMATRTILDGTSVLWQPGDRVAICYGGTIGEFVNDAATPSATCDFTGIISVIGVPDGNTYYGAVYPYNGSSSYYFSGYYYYLPVPSEQTAVDGSFDPAAFPSVARTLDKHLFFRNLCGGVILRFSEGCQNYSSVVFHANGLELLTAREVTASIKESEDGEIPSPAWTYHGKPEVTLTAPDGGFKPGVDYYVSMLPCTLRDGFSIAIKNNGGQVAVKEYGTAQEIKRSVFGRPGVLDTGLEWKDIDPVAGNAGLIQKQWLYEDSEGAKWIYDIGHSIPGLMLQMDAGDPVFTQSTMHRYSLERDLFGKTRIVLTDVDEEAFYQIGNVQESAMTCRYFYGYFEYGYNLLPVDRQLLPVASTVIPKYKGIWVDVDGKHYDINITDSYPGMYDAFLQIAAAHDGGLPIVYLNKCGTAADFEGVDVAGKVAVVKRGDNSFGDKVTNAYNAGAVGVLIVNNQAGTVNCNVEGKTQIPHGSLLQEVGPKLAGKTWIRCYRPGLEQFSTGN